MFGKRLKEVRKLNNFTQKQLAKLLDVSESAITNWERGFSCPSIENIAKICTTCNVSANYLLGIEEDFMLNLNSLTPNTIMFICKIVNDKKSLQKQ